MSSNEKYESLVALINENNKNKRRNRERQKEVKDFSTITSLLKKKKFYSLPKVFDAFILLDEEMKKRAKIKNRLIFGNFSSLSFH